MSPEAYEFVVLGGLDLRGPDGASVRSLLAQPRRVALLAYLVLESAHTPVQRDELLDIFWPESDEEKARNALRTALSYVRRSLGPEIVVTQGTLVALAPDLILTDVAQLLDAAQRGAHEEVLRLYTGEFLPAFHVAGNRFEDWLQAKRRAVERARVTAAIALSGSGADPDLWLSHLDEVVAAAPQNELAGRTLVEALGRINGAAIAYARYQTWAEALRSRVGLEPSAEMDQLAQRLIGAGASRDVTPAPAAPRAPQAVRATPDVVLQRSPPPAVTGWTGRRVLGWAVGGLAVVVLAVLLRPPRPPTGRGPPPDGYLVAEFGWRGPAGSTYLKTLVPELLSRHLESSGARYLGWTAGSAGRPSCSRNGPPVERPTVTGTVEAGSDGVYRVRACLLSTDGKVGSEATTSTTEPDIQAAARALAATLWEGFGIAGAFTPAPRMTQAPGALPAYARAEVLRRAGKFSAAAEAYTDAVALDSTFAWAHYRRSTALEWLGDEEQARRAADRALAASERLSRRENDLLDAWRAYVWGEVLQAAGAYERLADERPSDPEVLFRAGELRFHWGSRLGISRAAADSAFTAVLEQIPGHAPSLIHHARYVGYAGDLKTFVDLVDRAEAEGAGEDEITRLRTGVALRTGDTRTLRDVSVPWLLSKGSAVECALYLGFIVAEVPEPAMAMQLIDLLPRGTEQEVGWRWMEINVLASAGRFEDAHIKVDSLRRLNAARAVEAEVLLAMTPIAYNDRSALEDLRRRLMRLPPPPKPMGSGVVYIADRGIFPLRRVFLWAWLTQQIDGVVSDEAALERTRRFPDQFQREYDRLIRELEAISQDDPERVLNEIGSPRILPDHLYPAAMSYVWALERWYRIQALLRVGRDEEALQWLGTFPDASGHDVAFLGPVLVERGETLERRGDRRGAADAYARALELWSDADDTPSLAGWRERARSGLDRTGTGTP